MPFFVFCAENQKIREEKEQAKNGDTPKNRENGAKIRPMAPDSPRKLKKTSKKHQKTNQKAERGQRKRRKRARIRRNFACFFVHFPFSRKKNQEKVSIIHKKQALTAKKEGKTPKNRKF